MQKSNHDCCAVVYNKFVQISVASQLLRLALEACTMVTTVAAFVRTSATTGSIWACTYNFSSISGLQMYKCTYLSSPDHVQCAKCCQRLSKGSLSCVDSSLAATDEIVADDPYRILPPPSKTNRQADSPCDDLSNFVEQRILNISSPTLEFDDCGRDCRHRRSVEWISCRGNCS